MASKSQRRTRSASAIIAALIALAVGGCALGLSIHSLAAVTGPTVMVSPTSAPAGASVKVSGTGWTNSPVNPQYQIYWETKGGTLLGSFAPVSTSFSVFVTIPVNAAAGAHQIVACEGVGGEFQACLPQTVTVSSPTPTRTATPSVVSTATRTPTRTPTPASARSVNVNPSSAAPGASIKVSGTGWTNSPVNPQYQIYWEVKGGTVLGSFAPVANSFSVFVSIPANATQGQHQIVACEGVGGEFQACASATFTVVNATATRTPAPHGTPTATATSQPYPLPPTGLILQPPAKYGAPIQRAIRAGLASRSANGLPVPEASYDFSATLVGPDHLQLTGTTVLTYSGPQEAGLDAWPSLVIGQNNLPACAEGYTCTVLPGDYNQAAKNYVETQLPGIWDHYQYRHEPRIKTITETYEVSYESAVASQPAPAAGQGAGSAAGSATQDILLGFTAALRIDQADFQVRESVHFPLVGDVELFYFRCCFRLDLGAGLRLPLRAHIQKPESLTEKDQATLISSLEALDWSHNDFANAGIYDPGSASDDPASGKEFVLKFDLFAGIQLRLLGQSVVDYSINPRFDLSRSFRTPFGAGASFPIPPVHLNPADTGLQLSFTIPVVNEGASIGIGFDVQPTLGSQRIDASWQASGDAAGSGTVSYAAPKPATASVGPINVGDFSAATDHANVALSSFRYYLTDAGLDINATIQFGGFLAIIPDLPSVNLLRLNLADYFGQANLLGVHAGTNGTVNSSLFVRSWKPQVAVSPNPAHLLPGGSATLDVTVTNAGTVPDTFGSFRVSDLATGWSSTFERASTASLAPGASETLHLTITAPSSAAPGDHLVTVTVASLGETLADQTREASDQVDINVVNPPRPDAYAGNDSLMRAAVPTPTWSHAAHFRCSDARTGGPGVGDCSDVFSSALNSHLDAWEVWNLDIPALSLETATVADFFRVPIPDPAAAPDGHPDVDSGPGVVPLLECGDMTVGGRELATTAWLTVQVIPVPDPKNGRPVGTPGEAVKIYGSSGDPSLPPHAVVGSGATAVQQGIFCPRSLEHLTEIVTSFGERSGVREALATGGYTLRLNYLVHIQAGIPTWLTNLLASEEGRGGALSCMGIGAGNLPIDLFPPCSAGGPEFNGVLIGLQHPQAAARAPGCPSDGCPEDLYFNWSARADFDVTFTSQANLSIRLLDAAQNVVGSAAPSRAEQEQQLPSGAPIPIRSELRVGSLAPGLYVLEVSGPQASLTLSYTPIATPLSGDANCDGSVNPIDAALVLQFAAGLADSLACPAAADANSDGTTNAIDAALILQHSAGLLP